MTIGAGGDALDPVGSVSIGVGGESAGGTSDCATLLEGLNSAIVLTYQDA